MGPRMWDVAKTLQISLNLSTFIFMVASLLDMGLRLELEEALRGLRNVRFVALSLLAGFVMCPALAYLLTKVVPLERPYAIGMILLSMTPCAPFLPIMVDRARGDLSYAAAFMLLASVVTPIYMPLAVPLLAQGLAADAWTIAKPVLLFILLPLLIGIAIRLASAPLATKLQPLARTAAAVSTILIVVLIVILYGRGFVSAMGSYAFGNSDSVLLRDDRRHVRSQLRLARDTKERVGSRNVHAQSRCCSYTAPISSGC